MDQSVIALFDDASTARRAVDDLVAAGFDRDDISVVAHGGSGYDTGSGAGSADDDHTGAATGATVGAVTGGAVGVAAGLGALAIPGIGPIVAAGPLIAGLTGAGIGAAGGGLLGALADWGVPDEDAEIYSEGVRRGGTLVALRTDATRADRAADILERYQPVDIHERSTSWREGGWSRFDHNAQPYSQDDLHTERQRYGLRSPDYNQGGSDGLLTGTGTGTTGMGTAGLGASGAGMGAIGTTGYDSTANRSDAGYTDRSDDGQGLGDSLSGAARSVGETLGLTGDNDRDRLTGSSTTGGTYSGTDMGTERLGSDRLGLTDRDSEQAAIPVVEEELHVGKREVRRGGVRVHSRVREIPVEERVTLRDETVNVERRAVDRPIEAGEAVFQDRDIEVTETDEEAVIAKQARVTEEIVVSKGVDIHEETVRDTVRKTEVDIDRTGTDDLTGKR
ncbi:MAG TPA: YsnF/AvaK domain-containing protein [Alphaproteobacteria bacterium]|nr:YsnF/AvaK domain-containing protein [Alphaproteobacteria bacterium]